MTDHPSSETKSKMTEPPAPEVLRPQADDGTPDPETAVLAKPHTTAQRRRATYRPSHKATFIGVAVVAAILTVNAVIIYTVMQGQATANAGTNPAQVSISSAALDKLGVSRNPVGNSAEELVIGPKARFNGKVTISSDMTIAGQLTLNSKFSATDASLANLQAGNTSVSQLNVNGDGTVSNLNLRKDLTVLGLTRLQGSVTIGQLLTVNNNVNISGNLAVGGILSARGFQASSLVSDSTLTIGGHVITRGAAPGVGPGNGLGANGTVSISGNDASGTVAANIGTGGGNGILAQVSFRSQYSNTPHVVVTTVGAGMGSVYVNRTAWGFSIGVNGAVGPGGYAIDYIVMQ